MDLDDFVAFHSCSNINRALADDIIILLEAKNLDNFIFHALLVTVARGCCQAYTKLCFDELCKVLRFVEHKDIRLINEDQRVLLCLKVAANMVLNSVLKLSQVPKIFEVDFVSCHQVFVGIY